MPYSIIFFLFFIVSTGNKLISSKYSTTNRYFIQIISNFSLLKSHF